MEACTTLLVNRLLSLDLNSTTINPTVRIYNLTPNFCKHLLNVALTAVVINNQEYTIPDECYGFSSPSYLNDSRLLIVDSFSYYYKEYVSTWGITAGINIDGVDLDFAFSHTKGQIDALLQDEVNFLAQNILSWNQFVIQMWPGKPTLSPQ